METYTYKIQVKLDETSRNQSSISGKFIHQLKKYMREQGFTPDSWKIIDDHVETPRQPNTQFGAIGIIGFRAREELKRLEGLLESSSSEKFRTAQA